MSKTHSKPIETLPLSSKERRKVVDQLNWTAKQIMPPAERRAMRLDYAAEQMVATITHPNGQQVTYSVVPRNLSQWGVAFLHGRFVYPNSPVVLLMPMRGGTWQQIAGRIVRCRHVSGMMHEVSAQFDVAITVSEFVSVTREQEMKLVCETEARMDADAIAQAKRGGGQEKAVIFSTSNIEVQLLQHWMSQLGITAEWAVNEESLGDLIRETGATLVVVDLGVDSGPGLAAMRALRSNGQYNGLMLALSADESKPLREEAMTGGANAFVVKPISGVGALQQCLSKLRNEQHSPVPVSHAGDALYSTMMQDPEMRPLIGAFVRNVTALGQRLEESLKAGDRDQLLRLCLDIKGSGGGYGFAIISQSAMHVLAELKNHAQVVAAVRKCVQELIDLIARVRSD
jgi:CheY-like chemotaxis protein/HPt (histidine-containing phosphotransfer) domain-containing protein